MLKNYTEKEEITCLVHDAHWKREKDEENSFWWSGQISSNWFRVFVLNGFEIPKLSRDYGDSLAARIHHSALTLNRILLIEAVGQWRQTLDVIIFCVKMSAAPPEPREISAHRHQSVSNMTSSLQWKLMFATDIPQRRVILDSNLNPKFPREMHWFTVIHQPHGSDFTEIIIESTHLRFTHSLMPHTWISAPESAHNYALKDALRSIYWREMNVHDGEVHMHQKRRWKTVRHRKLAS